MTSNRAVQLVLVVYYTLTIAEIGEIVEDFSRATGVAIGRTIIVDNSGALAGEASRPTVDIVKGDNTFWEFSGWLSGLARIGANDDGLTILINDSYRRNWTVKWPGRRVFSAMLNDADRGFVAGWLDNFTRTSRRVNSRIVVLPTALAPMMHASIAMAITALKNRRSAGLPLFDMTSFAVIERFMAKHDGRWDAASAATRWPRIFLEHHLFDGIPTNRLRFRPRTWIGSQLYGIAYKFAGERR